MDNDPMEKFNFFEDLRFIDGKKKRKNPNKTNRQSIAIVRHPS